MSFGVPFFAPDVLEGVQEVEKAWWATGPVPDGQPQVTLTFEDVSTKYHGERSQTWDPETVVASMEETFHHAFQRFRVQANKKYRHPFRPALSFEVIYGDQQARIAFDDAAQYTVKQVVDMLGGATTLTYARDDYGKAWEHETGQLKLRPWQRNLPSWCTTPTHWLEPTAPVGMGRSGVRPGIFDHTTYEWRKVSTLCLPGFGGNIIPTATVPTLIASSVFLIVQCINLQVNIAEDDHVIPSEKLDPTSVTLNDVKRLLLGRYIQTSSAPLIPHAEDVEAEERPAKRAKKEPVKQRAGIVWGYEPSTRRLYCVTTVNTEFIVDLSVKASDATGPNPEAIRSGIIPEVTYCEWLGPVSLAVDSAATKEDADKPKELEDTSFAQFSAWKDAYEQKVKDLNASKDNLTFEVGEDGSMVAGDVNLSKGPEDEFECDIEDVKPGMWTVTCIRLSEEDGERYNGDEDKLGGNLDDSDIYAGRALKIVMRHSDVDGSDLKDASWKHVGSFSVDSGVWGIFSVHELEKAIEGSGDRESALECLADWAMDEGPKSPAGIAASGDDGGYIIQGRKIDDTWAQFRILG